VRALWARLDSLASASAASASAASSSLLSSAEEVADLLGASLPASLEPSFTELARRLDADLDGLGDRVEALATIIGAALEAQSGAGGVGGADRDRTPSDVGDQLARLRDAALGVGQAVRAEARRRRGGQPSPGDGGA
jgi:hypothetical protein